MLEEWKERQSSFFLGCFCSPAYAVGNIFFLLFDWLQAVTGGFLLCVLMPYFAVLSYANAGLRLCTAIISDRQISLMNQVFSGIRAIKMHAWRDEYRQKIKHIGRYDYVQSEVGPNDSEVWVELNLRMNSFKVGTCVMISQLGGPYLT